MTLVEDNRKFIDSLLEYYISEAKSYKQIAENFVPKVKSTEDVAFGIIVGCVYSGFLQACQNQKKSPDLEDIKEFYQILNKMAPKIKESLSDKSV